MKKKLLLLLILATTGLSYAQKDLSKDYSYTVSEPYKVYDGDKFYVSKDNHVLNLKLEGKEVIIQKLDGAGAKMVFKSEKKYEDLPKNIMAEDMLEFNGRYYFFYSSWDGGDVDNEQLFAREIDFEKGEFTGDAKLLFKVDGRVTGSPRTMLRYYSFNDFNVKNKFDFLMSVDKKKMLIQYRKKPEIKRDKKSFDIIGMVSYEGNLTQTSSNEIKMPYTERKMDVLDFALDAEGTNYILAKVYHDDSGDDKKRKKDEEANYHVELFRLTNGSKELNIAKVDVKDKFINGLWLFESPLTKEMVCAGYYNNGKTVRRSNVMTFADGKKVAYTDGMIIIKAKKEGPLYGLATYEIPIDVLNEYTSNRTKKKNNKKEEEGEAEFPYLMLKELIIDEKGNLLLIGEQTYVIVRQGNHGMPGPSTSMMSYDRFYFHYNDLLVTKIDATGKLSWIKKIPKKQKGMNYQGGMSYKYIRNKDSHYLLFLDNLKNFELPLDKVPAEHSDGKGGYFTSYKIDDATGTSVNSSIFNVRDLEEMTVYQFATNRIVKLTDDTFAVEFYKKKKEDVMVKVTIK